MAPSRGHKQVFQPGAKWEFFRQIATDSLPFMKNEFNRMIQVPNRLRKSEPDGFFSHLLLESTEQPVPDDEAHAHIFVEVDQVAGMVNAVVAGAHKDSFEPAGHFFDCPGVYEYTIGLRNGIHKYDIEGVKAYKGQRNKINETVYGLKDRGSEPGSQVEFNRGMMGDMDSPENTTKMIDPVFCVKGEVFENKKQKPISVHIFNLEKMVQKGPVKYTDIKCPPQQNVQTCIDDREVDVLKGIFEGIKSFLLPVAQPDFCSNKNDIEWRRN